VVGKSTASAKGFIAHNFLRHGDTKYSPRRNCPGWAYRKVLGILFLFASLPKIMFIQAVCVKKSSAAVMAVISPGCRFYPALGFALMLPGSSGMPTDD
jgi:hypothetical protein